MFYRGSFQYSSRRFSAYGNYETGNDLQNKTLFATNTVSTTLLGASLTAGKNWEFQFEAYRNNLITELNPQSIFVLQGQGVFIPGTLAALNQWSTYFRAVRNFHWGVAGAGDVNAYALKRAPLKGSVEGFVMERLAEGNRPAEGVSVVVDGRAAVTDAEGRFQLTGVPEGDRKVLLALHELPAEFDPGKIIETMAIVHPDKPSHAELGCHRAGFHSGKSDGAEGCTGGEHCHSHAAGRAVHHSGRGLGNFYFYNLREGEYELVLDKKTLPEFAVMSQVERVPVSVKVGRQPEAVNFQFEIKLPQKPVLQRPRQKMIRC